MNKQRYIIRGLIDGCLSVLGVIIGGYNPDFTIIISAGISGAIANGFSNVLAALSAEEAARYKYLRELEESMLTDLSDTAQEKKVKSVIRTSAAYDGISTVVGGIIPILPFFLFNDWKALALAIIITISIFLGLGYYNAKLSKRNVIIYILKMLTFAILTALAGFIIRKVV